jgi:hypothetical protein
MTASQAHRFLRGQLATTPPALRTRHARPTELLVRAKPVLPASLPTPSPIPTSLSAGTTMSTLVIIERDPTNSLPPLPTDVGTFSATDASNGTRPSALVLAHKHDMLPDAMLAAIELPRAISNSSEGVGPDCPAVTAAGSSLRAPLRPAVSDVVPYSDNEDGDLLSLAAGKAFLLGTFLLLLFARPRFIRLPPFFRLC